MIILALIGVVLGLLIFTRLPADAVLMGVLTLIMVVPIPHDGGWTLGILDARQALAGFSNPGMLTVGVLFVIVAGLRSTGAIDWLGYRVLGRPSGVRSALIRITAPVSLLSTFLNNTPVVAMLIPAVSDWARRCRLPMSKLLIPLSYAAILGGTCSLIGTSTNLVVSGLVTAYTDLPAMRMFDVAWIGVPCALIGALFLVCAGPKLLPLRGAISETLSDPREYIAEMIVPPESPMVGKTVEQAGLRQLPGCYLVEIDRDGELLVAVAPDQTLKANDRLVFAGVVESIRELQNLRGLLPATDQVFKLDWPRHRRCLVEAVVSNTCPIVGKTIKEGRFRTVYDAAVLAVARNGERVRGRIGDITLRPGDVLLLEANPSFEPRLRNARDFLLIRALEESAPRRHRHAPVALGILLSMVIAAALGWLDMLHAAMLAGGLMIMTRCCSIAEARQSVDWSVLIVIGAALGMGEALKASGAARTLAESLLAVAGQHP